MPHPSTGPSRRSRDVVPSREQIVAGHPTTLFHTRSRPRPLEVLERRADRLEMVIDLRDDERPEDP